MVAAALAYDCGGDCGIYNVGTLEHARRRGLGTTSLAESGEGLGTLGLPAPVLRDLAAKAGFAQVRPVEMDNPFNSLYELAR